MGARRNEISDLQAPDNDLEKLEKFFEDQLEPKVMVVGHGKPHISVKAIRQLQEAGITVAEAVKGFEAATRKINKGSEKFNDSLKIIDHQVKDLKNSQSLVKPQSKYHK